MKKKTKKKNKEQEVVENAEVVETREATSVEDNNDTIELVVEERVEVLEATDTVVEPGAESETAVAVVSGDAVTDINEVEAAVTALVFASPVALSVKKLKNLLTHGGYDVSQLDLVLESLSQTFENKGIQLVKVSGGYQLRTNPKYTEIVQKLVEERPQRLSKSALEVLAIVAYKQPITRADIDHVRGTDSGHLLKNLLEKNLVRTEGHKETAGRPLLYGTTPYFLEVFTLGSLDDLPALEDFERELKDANTEDGMVLDADPGFFDTPSGLDADADRGQFDARAEDEFENADFGVNERAVEEVSNETH